MPSYSPPRGPRSARVAEKPVGPQPSSPGTDGGRGSSGRARGVSPAAREKLGVSGVPTAPQSHLFGGGSSRQAGLHADRRRGAARCALSAGGRDGSVSSGPPALSGRTRGWEVQGSAVWESECFLRAEQNLTEFREPLRGRGAGRHREPGRARPRLTRSSGRAVRGPSGLSFFPFLSPPLPPGGKPASPGPLGFY